MSSSTVCGNVMRVQINMKCDRRSRQVSLLEISDDKTFNASNLFRAVPQNMSFPSNSSWKFGIYTFSLET